VKNFSEAVFADVLRAWCKHTPASLEKLRGLAKAGLGGKDAMDEYVIAVHGLKGSSYGICAKAVGKAAETLEAAGRRGDAAFVEANTDAFLEEAALLYVRLREFLDSRAEKAEAKATARAPDPALLAEFLSSCKQYKSSAMEETLKKLESFEYETGGGLVSWLREQTDNLEYEAIEKRLAGELSA
jgi:HPt (histidine-containing phosphotransfer) domain-containing protein